MSYNEAGEENKLDLIRERRESAGKPTQWPGIAWGRYFRSQERLEDRIWPPPSSLSRSIYFLDNKFRRASSGSLLISGKRAGHRAAVFGIALKT